MSRCDTPGCSNRIRWSPIIVVRPAERHEPSAPLRVPTEISICNVCKHGLVFEDMLNAGFKTTVEAETARRGMAPPDWERTTLDWQDVAERDEELARARPN